MNCDKYNHSWFLNKFNKNWDVNVYNVNIFLNIYYIVIYIILIYICVWVQKKRIIKMNDNFIIYDNLILLLNALEIKHNRLLWTITWLNIFINSWTMITILIDSLLGLFIYLT